MVFISGNASADTRALYPSRYPANFLLVNATAVPVLRTRYVGTARGTMPRQRFGWGRRTTLFHRSWQSKSAAPGAAYARLAESFRGWRKQIFGILLGRRYGKIACRHC